MYLQRRKWKHDNTNALCWSFYCENDNKPLDVKCFQLMRCIFCYVSPILITNAKTQTRKGLILYNNANGIITLKKHVYVDHCMITKIFEENILKKFKRTLWEATCKEIICPTYFGNLLICKNKFWFVDVKGGLWHFCPCYYFLMVN